MKNKIIQSIPLLIALFGSISAPVSYWCIYSNTFCYGTWIHQIYPYFINPLYNLSVFFLPLSFILIFVSRNIFVSWLKFAAWAIPVLILYIAITPVSFSGLGINFFPFYRDDAARLAGQVFSVISLVLLIWKFISARSKKS